jgi:hypothetical protein
MSGTSSSTATAACCCLSLGLLLLLPPASLLAPAPVDAFHLPPTPLPRPTGRAAGDCSSRSGFGFIPPVLRRSSGRRRLLPVASPPLAAAATESAPPPQHAAAAAAATAPPGDGGASSSSSASTSATSSRGLTAALDALALKGRHQEALALLRAARDGSHAVFGPGEVGPLQYHKVCGWAWGI